MHAWMLSYSVSRPHSFKKGTPMYWSLLGNWLPDPPFYANAWRSWGSGKQKLRLKDTGLALKKRLETRRGGLTSDRDCVLSAPL